MRNELLKHTFSFTKTAKNEWKHKQKKLIRYKNN